METINQSIECSEINIFSYFVGNKLAFCLPLCVRTTCAVCIFFVQLRKTYKVWNLIFKANRSLATRKSMRNFMIHYKVNVVSVLQRGRRFRALRPNRVDQFFNL